MTLTAIKMKRIKVRCHSDTMDKRVSMYVLTRVQTIFFGDMLRKKFITDIDEA